MRARGLKYGAHASDGRGELSRPHAGAWIEITAARPYLQVPVSRPHAGAWIEISPSVNALTVASSRPHAGAWIEICMRLVAECRGLVAPPCGRVD